jgi:pimeloyl-ACP methyl ester carboxylesterase
MVATPRRKHDHGRILRSANPAGVQDIVMAKLSDLFWSSADGLRLHARDYAGGDDKTPVICIHGLTRNSRDFEDLAPMIAATGRRVIAVDVRGRGQSARDPNPANYHPGTYATDIVTLMAQQGMARAVFIGTSMGGLITMVLAAFAPQVIAAAVLNDVGPELSPVGIARIGGYVGQGKPVETWADAAAYARTINASAFPDAPEAEWDRFARRTFREGEDGKPALDYDPDIALAFKVDPDAPPVPVPDMWPLFRALTTGRPTLLIRGELSDLVDEAIAAKMRQAAPDMAYAEVPRVGHAPMLTEPAAWSAIEAFLERLP